MVNIKSIPRWFMFLFTSGFIAAIPNSALAADKVTFEYGAISESVPIEELEAFATTGETSASIDTILKASNQHPWVMRRVLIQQVPANNKAIYDLLNTAPGEYVLSQTSNVVGTRSDRANKTALRGALITCASNDNRVSLLELLQEYPVEQVYVNGKLLAKARRNLTNFVRDTRDYIRIPILQR